MRVAHPSLSLLAVSLVLTACAGSGDKKTTTGTAGAGQGTAGSGASSGSTGSAGSASGTAGSASGAAGSTSGAAGSTSGAAGAGAAGTTGTAGSAGTGTGTAGSAGTGSDGGAGSSNTDSGTHVVDGAPVTTAGCANHNYALCMDFESPVDTTVWSGGNAAAIETTEVAHGTHAYHLYSDQAAAPKAGVLTTSKLGTL